MRSLVAIVLAIGIASPVLGAAPAAAATAVTIERIPNRTISHTASTAAIRPQFTTSGRLRVDSARLTVRKNGREIADKVKVARLRPGTYRVRAVVRYRPYHLRETGETTVKQVRTAGPGLPAVEMSCRIVGMSRDSETSSYYNFGLNCTSDTFDRVYRTGGWFEDLDGDGVWSAEFIYMESWSPTVTTTDPESFDGQTLVGWGTPDVDFYVDREVPVRERVYRRSRTVERTQWLQVTRSSGPYVNSKGCANAGDMALVTPNMTRSRVNKILGGGGVGYGNVEWVDFTGDGAPDVPARRQLYPTCDPADTAVVWFTFSLDDGKATPEDLVISKSYHDG